MSGLPKISRPNRHQMSEAGISADRYDELDSIKALFMQRMKELARTIPDIDARRSLIQQARAEYENDIMALNKKYGNA